MGELIIEVLSFIAVLLSALLFVGVVGIALGALVREVYLHFTSL